jgi:hypothetical protein
MRNSNADRGFSKNRYYNQSEFESAMRRTISYLRSLANRRSSGIVTADDVHTFLNREGVQPQQIRTRLRFINSAFASGMFEQVGRAPSSRPRARGRTIAMWTTVA